MIFKVESLKKGHTDTMIGILLTGAISAIFGSSFREVIGIILTFAFKKIIFTVNDRNKVETICNNLKNIKSSQIVFEKGKFMPHGFIYAGHNILAYVETDVIHIFTTRETFNELTENQEDKQKDKSKILENYERHGTYEWIYYEVFPIDITFLIPTTRQSEIIQEIKSKFIENNKKLAVFIHGPPGTGKTSLAMLIAHEIDATFCKSCNPCEPGDSLENLMRNVGTSKTKPHDQLFDEFDCIINKVHNNTVVLHKNVPIPVFDKSTFNRFMDNRQYISNLLMICTSNKTKQWIDKKYDPSYIRNGRIDMYISMNEA